jgi:hypothetical protein
MAKSSRASTIKSNNQRLKKNVFGPVEAARNERLSARLLALAAEAKPQKDVEMTEGMLSVSTSRGEPELMRVAEPADEPKEAAAQKDDCKSTLLRGSPRTRPLTLCRSHGRRWC